MSKENFIELLKKEIIRIDNNNISKRNEKIIEGFSHGKAIIEGKEYLIFNSNDYLGMRHNEILKKAEEEASGKYGSGPGAVRFISGTLKIHKELEKEIASFHNKEDAIVFSSAFAANLAVIHCMIKGQSKDSLIGENTLVISDELNHRSIIDGIRVAGLSKENKTIFKHLDITDLRRVLDENKGKFNRVVVITDGVFSMLGEYQDLKQMQETCDEYDSFFEEGIITIVDDSHGVACFGETGRGCEEVCDAYSDILVGTLGKGFGSDGGYVTGNKIFMDYLRESAATYIYSNSISPGTAGAALASITLIKSEEGKKILAKLSRNINYFKNKMTAAGFTFAAESKHAIQPILIGDASKSKMLTDALFKSGIVVTSINYPVVPKGKDEIRVQISSAHKKENIDEFIEKIIQEAKKLKIISYN